ncbi:TPA: restriction endonuclease subunit S [Streptococcus suis]|nr:restriction endonuclease subunit S [Streptococcus suis]
MPNKDKNIPKRRFKAFENADAWELRKLGEVVYRSNLTSSSKDLPRLEFEDINSGLGTLNKDISQKVDDRKGLEFNEGDVLFGKLRPYLKNWWYAEFKGIALGDFWNLKSDLWHSCFLYTYIQSNSFQLVANDTSGTKMPRSDWNLVAESIAKFPSLPEQEAIGTFFSTLDRHITLHQRKLDKLKSVKQAYLSEMFPAEGERVPKRRFPGFTDDWELRKLGELTSYRNGKGYEDNQSDFGKYELINLNSISIEGGLKPSGKFINSASETLNKNDLVMVLSDVGHGDLLGRVAIIPEDDRFVLNQRVALLRNNDYADCKYLFAYINANQHYFKLQGAGSSQLNISKKAVENFVVHIPSQKEQKAIGTFFSTLDQHITLHQRKLEKLKNLKKALLNELFV